MYLLKRVGSLAGVEIGSVGISEILLDVPRCLRIALRDGSIRRTEPMDRNTLQRSQQKQLSYLVAQEAGEVAVPMAYLACWCVVVVGPNRASFSGTGTSDFGLDPPEDVSLFLAMSSLLIVASYRSVMFMRALVRRACKIDLQKEERRLFQSFGVTLIIQTTWVVVTACCMTMIQCGLGYPCSTTT